MHKSPLSRATTNVYYVHMRTTKQQGFTLLEILLVVAAIAILAGIIIVAINPARQLGETRNAQRKVDVRTILSAVQQYQLKNGSVPDGVPTVDYADGCIAAEHEICATDGSCSNYINLNVLTDGALYITAMPKDPQGGTTVDGTGYAIVQLSSNNRVVVCSLKAELNESISAQQ